MSKKEKSRSYAIVGVIAAMVLIISIAAIVMMKYHSYKANKQYEDLQNQMTANVTAVPEAVSEETTEETESKPPKQEETQNTTPVENTTQNQTTSE